MDKPPPIVGGERADERSRVYEGETSPKTGRTACVALACYARLELVYQTGLWVSYGKNIEKYNFLNGDTIYIVYFIICSTHPRFSWSFVLRAFLACPPPSTSTRYLNTRSSAVRLTLSAVFFESRPSKFAFFFPHSFTTAHSISHCIFPTLDPYHDTRSRPSYNIIV